MITFTINTRYNQPTENKGSSITAYVTSGVSNTQITVAYDYELNVKANHDEAANKLAAIKFEDYDTCHSYKETSSKRGYRYSGYIFDK